MTFKNRPLKATDDGRTIHPLRTGEANLRARHPLKKKRALLQKRFSHASMGYNVSVEDQLLEVTISEGLNKAEILRIWDAIEQHPLYQQAAAGLVFLKQDTKWDVTADEIADLGQRIRKLRALPWAFVASDPLSFGMIRMFEAYAKGGGAYHAFSSEISAREWLRSRDGEDHANPMHTR